MPVRRNLLRLCVLTLALVLTGAGCGGPSRAEELASKPVTLDVWRVFDDAQTLDKIMDDYRALHPNVSFNYRELRFDEYEDELIRAFAEGRGPDIYSIHNTWIGEYESLLSPMPSSVTIPFVEVRGSIKKEVVYTLEEKPTLSVRKLKNDYVEVVVNDVVRTYKGPEDASADDRIFALPLGLDTLVLFYNKDILDAGGFPNPPTTWTQFQSQVGELTRLGPNDQIIQAGAAMGTAENTERATDILSILMQQNGVRMVDNRGFASFAIGEEEDVNLALDALRFYTDFANPLKQVYTWNDKQPNAFDAFASGDAAFFLGYSYHVPFIRASAPKLNFAISPLPQIEGGKIVNYANYWVETVARASDNKDWAWDFLLFATDAKNVGSYLERAGRPTARRDLINSQIEDENLSVFASQVLTSQSWYKGKNAAVAEKAMLELIKTTLSGENAQSALTLTQNKINQTF